MHSQQHPYLTAYCPISVLFFRRLLTRPCYQALFCISSNSRVPAPGFTVKGLRISASISHMHTAPNQLLFPDTYHRAWPRRPGTHLFVSFRVSSPGPTFKGPIISLGLAFRGSHDNNSLLSPFWVFLRYNTAWTSSDSKHKPTMKTTSCLTYCHSIASHALVTWSILLVRSM